MPAPIVGSTVGTTTCPGRGDGRPIGRRELRRPATHRQRRLDRSRGHGHEPLLTRCRWPSARRHSSRSSGRDGVGNVGVQAESPAVTATLYQERHEPRPVPGRWTNTTSSTASHRQPAHVHAGRRVGRVQRSMPGRSRSSAGRARRAARPRVYVDGVLAATIDLYRSTSRSRVVLFSRAWSTPGIHTVRLSWSGRRADRASTSTGSG